MQNKTLQNIIRNVLTFLIIFLVVNFIYNSFFSNDDQPEPRFGILINTTAKNFALHDIVEVEIQNNTANDLTIADTCPEQPLPVQFFNNGVWEDRTTSSKIDCTESSDIVIKPTETRIISFDQWNDELFNELGSYKILLRAEDQTLETNQFEIKPQSTFLWLWTVALYQPIYNALIFAASSLPGYDFGFAIILLTILIRTLLLIPNQKALKSQKKMQEIQPKIAELKEKHGDNKEKIAMETMAIYKEHKVNPFGSCLPLIIQLPILIALFQVIQSGLSTHNQYLLYGNLSEFDISLINTNFLGILELTEINFIVLPIVVGLLQFGQMKLAMSRSKKNQDPKKKAGSEMEIASRMMTTVMPIMIAIFTASVPAGVGLYWAFSTIYGIGQQLVINKQVDKDFTKIKVVDTSKRSKNKQKKQEYLQKNKEKKQDVAEDK